MTTYLVVSDLELLGPMEPKALNMQLGEDFAGEIVDGLDSANLVAAQLGAGLRYQGVTVYKLVEVAHYTAAEPA